MTGNLRVPLESMRVGGLPATDMYQAPLDQDEWNSAARSVAAELRAMGGRNEDGAVRVAALGAGMLYQGGRRQAMPCGCGQHPLGTRKGSAVAQECAARGRGRRRVMTSPPDGNIVISGRLLALLVTQERLRRLRIAHRADNHLYPELLVLSAVVLGRASTTEIAVAADGRNDWIMTDEAAQRLGVKPDTVRRMLRETRLRGTRHGRLWLVDAADVVRRQAC